MLVVIVGLVLWMLEVGVLALVLNSDPTYECTALKGEAALDSVYLSSVPSTFVAQMEVKCKQARCSCSVNEEALR